MRILIVSHSCITPVNQEVYIHLQNLPDTEVAVLTPENWVSDINGEHVHTKLHPDLNFPLWQAPVFRPGQVWQHGYTKLPIAKIKQFKPDVMLLSQEPWSVVGWQMRRLANQLKIPFAFQTNQNLIKNYPPPFGWWEKAMYKEAAMALGYSEEARQVLLTKGRTGPTAVVPYPINTTRFTHGKADDLLIQHGLQGKTVIGYMGRLVPEKGLNDMVDAAISLQDPNVALLFVGAGTEEHPLKERVKNLLGPVVFTGKVSHNDAGHYMQAMDIFVLPSHTMPNWKEQFGRVIIEAMACDIPVVGSNSGEIPNLIKATGGGLIFPEKDVTALAAHLKTLVANPNERERLGKQGAHVVQERYTNEAVARQLRALLTTF
jgi:glycosyltransferase involved in cell wall biosynthesis